MSNSIWWTLLVLALAFATYAAFVIKNEKKEAFDTGIDLNFHGFVFKVPRWWTATESKDDFIQFERTDTRYDWKACFHWLPISEEKDPQAIFEEMALKKNIVYDPETAVVKVPDMLENLKKEGIEALRVEGTATEDNEHRIYYDAFVLKGNGGFVFLESRSSILNGLLEGPFFEQCLLNTKKAP
jgi:hypothetical protein